MRQKKGDIPFRIKFDTHTPSLIRNGETFTSGGSCRQKQKQKKRGSLKLVF